ncbi:MAG: hypothetical protein HY720_25925 [Planctomycetes bacterium]|nr:hypothetical protein [Planctomycetota bacterium]
MTRRRLGQVALGAALVAGLVWGAFHLLAEEDSDEAKIASLLDRCEERFEEGDIDGVVDCFHPDFKSSQAKNRTEIRGLLLVIFRNRKKYSLSVSERTIEVEEGGAKAKSSFVVTGFEGEGLIPEGRDSYDVKVELAKNEGGDWLISWVDWKVRR